MAHLDQEPFFHMEKAWDDDDYAPDKIKFTKTTQKGSSKKSEVTPDNGERTIEWTIGVTVAEFRDAITETSSSRVAALRVRF